MMDDNGGIGDDQDSGWLEVKKKHRSTAKFSIRSWAGGFSGKNGSSYQLSQRSFNEKSGNLCGKQRSQLPKRGPNVPIRHGDVANYASVSNEYENSVCSPDKPMVKQGIEDSRCSELSQVSISDARFGDRNTQKIVHKDKLDVVPKIKWGDLEDDVLVLHLGNNSQTDISFDDTEDNNMVAKKLENTSHLFPQISGSINPQETKLVATSSNVDIYNDQTISQPNKEHLIEENCDIFSHDVEVPIMNGKMIAPNDVSNYKETHSEHVQPTNDDYSISACSSGEEDVTAAKVQEPVVRSEVTELMISDVAFTSGNSEVIPQDGDSLYTEKNGPEISLETGKVAKLQLPIVSALNESNISGLPFKNVNSVITAIPLDSESFPSEKSDPEFREAGIVVKIQMPVASEVNESRTSEVRLTDGNSSMAVTVQGADSLASGKCGPDISGESSETATSDYRGVAIGGMISDEIPITSGNSSTLVTAQDGESIVCKKCGPEISGERTLATSLEDCEGPLNLTIHDELSNVQGMSALREGEAGESKERYRDRLWCFLFENLNRAVDELYLLCELECDIVQMKEAILVLEEAASDFKELSIRVQEFENTKKSSQSIDGVPITLKSDHRRPHALSWEVRRMTTSPHRAEILSSSLEVFKKIQEERAKMLAANNVKMGLVYSNHCHVPGDNPKSAGNGDAAINAKRKQRAGLYQNQRNLSGEKRNAELGRSNKVNFVQNGCDPPHRLTSLDVNSSRLTSKDGPTTPGVEKGKRESESEKLLQKKDKTLTESTNEKNLKSTDHLKKQISLPEKDREKRNSNSWKSMDAWKEKRNWEDILSSPFRGSSRASHSLGMSRKSAERARILHDKLMSPEKKKKTALDLKREAEEKHARAMRIRSELENERVQKLQRTSAKLNRVNEWQAVRTMKLREGMYARHQRSESRHEAFLAQVVRRAGDESSKVNEVRFITSLNEENKKLMLRQKLQDSESRRAEKLQVIKTKQKEDMAREEAALERRKLIEAEKLQRLAETQRRKEEAHVRREEERKASSAAREARAIEQLRRREERAKAQQEEAELLAQKLAERLRESEQRRKFYLEQIRERASMDFRDQSSPLLRRSVNRDGQGRSTPTKSCEDNQDNGATGTGGSTLAAGDLTFQHSLKRRIKKIRQRLMAQKYEFLEPPVGSENAGIGYRTAVGTARAKLGRWLQELQRLRQARKEGAANIGLITAEMIKFLEGKDLELQASRQAGLLDFIASALPASHTSKPDACQVTIHLLKLLRVVLAAPANRSYFLAQNLLPPIIPMLSAALENYIKIAASLNAPGSTNLAPSKTSVESFESISEILDNFLWTVGAIIGHTSYDERELQMRDGLLELLIAYQVVHRLRDLFALYDRPQVEGSPFPSSILLSIHLLVVLTSVPRTNSSIDWESSPVDMVLGFDSQEPKHAEAADYGYSYVNRTSEDYRTPLSVVNGSTVVSASDISEGRLLNESCNTNKSSDLASIGKDGEDKPTYGSAELNNANMKITDVPDGSPKILTEGKDEKRLVNVGSEEKNNSMLSMKQPVAFLLCTISETGLVSLPSLLTSVLLQANNRLSSEQGSYVLPSNFEEVATMVLKVLNNLALLDITFMQRMLARPDLKMEFFHLMSFLLSHCASKWKVATDQVGLLLLEALLLLGYFALFHPENQAVLRWGKSPTILHKVCDLPFVFFSDPELMPVLAGSLVAACYGCEQNKGVVQQELSMDMLLSLLRSCRNVPPEVGSSLAMENLPTEDSNENNQQNSESKKPQGEVTLRSNRYNTKSTRVSLGKSGTLGNGIRGGKIRSQKDCKATKTCDEMALKQSPPASETSTMLHCRFPGTFIDRAEQFFSAGIANVLGDEV